MLPGWETLESIGSGGFSKVYRIKKTDSCDTGVYYAALKVIEIPHNSNEYDTYISEGYDENTVKGILKTRLDKLVSECQLMSQMKGNSNIVSYEDHIVIPNENAFGWKICIRMELLTPITKKETFTFEEVIKLGIDICKALEICEKKNIIHRDIKPQNIFFNDLGDFKLGDFGIAKTMDHLTQATRIGTFNYMAPEVYSGKPYDGTIDTYSLGLVMFWLLNEKRNPFVPLPPAIPTAEQLDTAQMDRLSGKKIPFTCNGNKAVNRIIQRACSYSTEERFSSPREMRKALEKVLLVADDEDVIVISQNETQSENPETALIIENANKPKNKGNKLIFAVVGVVLIILIAVMLLLRGCDEGPQSISGSSTTQGSVSETQENDTENNESNETEDTSSSNTQVNAEWSAWQEGELPDSSVYDIETKTQYSSRSITKVNSTSGWSSWSDWSFDKQIASDKKEVDTRTVYTYDVYRIRCGECTEIGPKDDIKMSYIGHLSQVHSADAASAAYLLVKDEYSSLSKKERAAKCEELSGVKTIYEIKTIISTIKLNYDDGFTYDSEKWYSENSGQENVKTQYRVRTRTANQDTKYGEWSEYSDSKVESSNSVEVRTRVVYRYRKKQS